MSERDIKALDVLNRIPQFRQRKTLCSMASKRTRMNRRQLTAVTEQDRNGPVSDLEPNSLTVKFATDHGLLTVRDGRLFQRGQETFCCLLATAAVRQQDVRSAHVDLGSSIFRLEFTPGDVDEKE